ncbi:hypothetical protein NC651_003628 [Populus alba x Populus x berolinensis]|nr:hypothetical protein NC651_003628 [Populus alba x Populus x berolinensis]
MAILKATCSFSHERFSPLLQPASSFFVFLLKRASSLHPFLNKENQLATCKSANNKWKSILLSFFHTTHILYHQRIILSYNHETGSQFTVTSYVSSKEFVFFTIRRELRKKMPTMLQQKESFTAVQ